MSSLRRRKAAPVQQWPLDAGITVVLFAGLGGACAGLEEAGCPVHVANNHDEVALAAHAALHPHTRHVRGDIFDVDPLAATRGRRVRVLWASPDCRDHSVAKGGAPRSARVRSLPWQVCRWAGKTRPEVIFVENVREIRGWGPLIAKRCKQTGRVLKQDGSVAASGEQVPLRQQQLVRDRARLGRSFRRFTAHLQALGYAYQDRDLNTADFGVPTARRRYFGISRRDGLPIGWPVPTHAPAAIAASLGLLPYVAAATIIDWSLPIPSIFDRKRPLAEATNRRVATGLQRFVLDNPRPFLVPLTHSGGVRVHDGAAPLPTVTTAHRGEFALVAPTIVRPGHTGPGYTAHRGQSASDPLQTLTGSPEFALTGALLAPAVMANNAQNIGASVDSPVPVLTTGNRNYVTGAYLAQTGYGERLGQAPRAQDIGAPIGTQVAGGGKHAVVAAWMVQHNLGATGHAAAEPLSTMTTRGTQQQVACGFLAHLRGASPSRDPAEPLPTLTAGGGHVAAVAAFLTKYYTSGGTAQDAADPLHSASTRMRFGVVGVQVDGLPYVVADIGMRMLEPHEAAAAHELRLPAAIEIAGKRRPLTKTEAMRLVGNSVPKRMARLLAEANAIPALTAQTGRSAA